MQKAWARPETRKRMTEAARAVWTPQKRAAHAKLLRKANSKPSVRVKRRAAAKLVGTQQAKVERRLRKQGWEVIHRGWPDFICIKGTRIRFIEAKAPGARPNRFQRKVHEILTRFGINVEVIRG